MTLRVGSNLSHLQSPCKKLKTDAPICLENIPNDILSDIILRLFKDTKFDALNLEHISCHFYSVFQKTPKIRWRAYECQAIRVMKKMGEDSINSRCNIYSLKKSLCTDAQIKSHFFTYINWLSKKPSEVQNFIPLIKKIQNLSQRAIIFYNMANHSFSTQDFKLIKKIIGMLQLEESEPIKFKIAYQLNQITQESQPLPFFIKEIQNCSNEQRKELWDHLIEIDPEIAFAAFETILESGLGLKLIPCFLENPERLFGTNWGKSTELINIHLKNNNFATILIESIYKKIKSSLESNPSIEIFNNAIELAVKTIHLDIIFKDEHFVEIASLLIKYNKKRAIEEANQFKSKILEDISNSSHLLWPLCLLYTLIDSKMLKMLPCDLKKVLNDESQIKLLEQFILIDCLDKETPDDILIDFLKNGMQSIEKYSLAEKIIHLLLARFKFDMLSNYANTDTLSKIYINEPKILKELFLANLKKPSFYIDDSLYKLAKIDLSDALSFLNENTPQDLNQQVIDQAKAYTVISDKITYYLPTNFLTGTLTIAEVLKLNKPTDFESHKTLAKTIINHKNLSLLLLSTNDYKKKLLEYFIWFDEQIGMHLNPSPHSLTLHLIKGIEKLAHHHQNPDLYQWLAEAALKLQTTSISLACCEEITKS